MKAAWLGLLLLALPGAARACSCAAEIDSLGRPMDPFNAITFRAAGAVFQGVAAEVRWDSATGRAHWRFEVRRWFKAPEGLARAKGIEIGTEGNSAACGYPFEAGKAYLVLAQATSREGAAGWETGLCPGNALLEADSGVLHRAREFRKAAERQARRDRRAEIRAAPAEHVLVAGGGATYMPGDGEYYRSFGARYHLKRRGRVGFHLEGVAGPGSYSGAAGGVNWWLGDAVFLGAGVSLILPWSDLPGNPITVPTPEITAGARWRFGPACLLVGSTATLLYGIRAFAGFGASL